MAQNLEHAGDENSTSNDMASNSDFLAVMLRRKWVVMLIAAFGIIAGVFAYRNTPPIYQSTARLVVERRFPSLRRDPTSADLAFAESLAKEDLSTQTIVIQSPENVRRAVDNSADLRALETFKGQSPDQMVGAIIGGMSITKGGDSISTEDANVLNVSYRGPVAYDCPEILKAVIAAYQEHLTDRYKLELAKSEQKGEEKIATKQAQLDEIQRRYDAFRKSSDLHITGKGASNPHSEALVRLEAERAELQGRLDEIMAYIDTIASAQQRGVPNEALVLFVERKSGSHGPDPTAATTSNMIEGQLWNLMLEEKQLLDTVAENHPRMKTIRKQIEMLQDLLFGSKGNSQEERLTPEKFLQQYAQSLNTEKALLSKQLTEKNKLIEVERENSRQLVRAEWEDEKFRRDIEQLTREVADARSFLELSRATGNDGGLRTDVIARANPGGQIQPVWARSLAVGGVLGLILGIVLAYVIDLADKSFRTPDEIRGHLRLPVIGHIPVIEGMMSRRREKKKTGTPGTNVDDMVACFHRPRSTVAEAYRSIRTALYFGTRGEEHKVIQVTSADAGDGKTTLAVNLAVSIAQSGRKVCLVDADFRRSRIHAMFGLEQQNGMSSVIAGKAELPDAIQACDVENLWILPCGPRPTNPSELLTSNRFKELLDVLRAKFDTILIDTPPLLAVTDPSAVAPRADSVLLVMRITKHVRPNAQRAKEVLDGLGAKVVGVVVNGVEVRRGYGHDAGYRRYGAGGYGYRDYDYGDYYADDETVEVPVNNNLLSNGKPAQSA